MVGFYRGNFCDCVGDVVCAACILFHESWERPSRGGLARTGGEGWKVSGGLMEGMGKFWELLMKAL